MPILVPGTKISLEADFDLSSLELTGTRASKGLYGVDGLETAGAVCVRRASDYLTCGGSRRT